MAVSESQKKASAKWDKNHAATLACKVPKEKAEAFRDYCADQGKAFTRFCWSMSTAVLRNNAKQARRACALGEMWL